MMNGHKLILKIWLGLYFVFTIFRIVHVYDSTILNGIFSIGTLPLQITSMILFVYVYERGDEGIGKIGIISVIISFSFYLLYKFSVYDLSNGSWVYFKDKICSLIYHTSGSCINICEYLAIFSLLQYNTKVEKYKLIAVACILIFSSIGLVNEIFPGAKFKFMGNIKTCLDYIGTLAKYAAIVFYLTSYDFVPTLFMTSSLPNHETTLASVNPSQPQEQVVLQTPPVMPQQVHESNNFMNQNPQ